MPRPTVKSKNTRLQTTDQDTFDYSTPNLQVVARPTDPYVKPVMSNDASAVAQFAESMQGFMKGFGNRKDRQHDIDVQAGKRAKVRKEDKPANASAGFIKGYETLEGVSGGADLYTKLNENYQANWQDTPAEFQAKQTALVKEFLNGRSDHYVDGLLNIAVEAENMFTKRHFEDNKKILDNNINSHLRNAVDGMVNISLEQGVNPSKLRQGLTDLQGLAMEQGRSRLETSDHFIDAVGPTAVKKGRPDLMMFAYERDGSGTRLVDNEHLMPKIVQYMRQATDEAENQAKALDQASKLKKQELKENVGRTLSEKLYTTRPEDHEGWNEMYSILNNASNPERNEFGVALDANEIEHYHKNIQSLRLGGNFAQVDDVRAYQKGYIMAKEGRLTGKDLTELESSLERETFKELIRTNAQAASASEGTAASLGTKFVKKFDDIFNDAMKTVDKTNPLLGILDQSGPDRGLYFTVQKHLLLEDFLRDPKNKGREPSTTEIHEMVKTAKEIAYDKFKAGFNFDIEGTGSPVGGSTKGSPMGGRGNNEKNDMKARFGRMTGQ